MSYSDIPNPDANPYRSPSETQNAAVGPLGSTPSPRVLTMLAQTRPWARFVSIMGFLASGLMIAAGIAGPLLAPLTDGETLFMVVYLPVAILYVIPSLFLFRYASRIRILEQSPGMGALAHALEAQKSFWRFVGISMAVILVFYAMGVAVILVAVMLGAALS